MMIAFARWFEQCFSVSAATFLDTVVIAFQLTTSKRWKHMWNLLATARIWIEYLERSVEIAAALIIGMAALQATVRSLQLFFRPGAPPKAKNGVRLTLGRWLAIALERSLRPTF